MDADVQPQDRGAEHPVHVHRQHGQVLSARLTPDAVRLTVAVDGVGEVHAVGDLDAALPTVGNDVHLVLDLTRAARLIGSGTGGGRP